MELETLEVLLDINLAKVDEALDRFMPQIENAMSKIERITGNSMGKTEKNMDIEKGTTNFNKQLEKMTQTFEKTMSNLEKTTKQSSDSVGNNLSSGIRKARPKVTKEIDAMVNEINSKMGQAKAAQEKVAYLKSQRQSASNKGDTGQVVKYDEQIARAQAQMIKFQDQAKGMGTTIKRELDSVPSSLDNITKGMSQNEAQIEAMRKRIRTLKAEYNDQRVPTGSFTSGFKTYEDTPQSLKTSGEIQKQSTKMSKLISDNDRLQKEYAQTEDRAEALRKALQRVNSTLGQSSIQTGSAANGASMTGSGLKQSERAVSKYGGVFNRMSNAISHGFGSVGNGLKSSLGFIGKFGSLFSSNSNKVTSGTNRMTGSTNAFGQSMKYLLPSLVVYQLIGGAIRTLASGIMSALKTNDQFSSSLNQIKVNLMTAFYPIYTAILPALNALMSTIAQLTGQLASFISMLFGTTYDAAKQGASGLYNNVKALEDTESSASNANESVKKLQKSLMGFDEINKLDMSSDDDSLDPSSDSASAPGIDFGAATGTYTTPKWMKDIQKLLKDFFKPFQDAWKNQGQKVIDAWKYALGEVIGLASAIGKSFMEVWTNGTGQKLIENILILLADALNIIGDIAKAFKNAWNDGGRGTALIQSIFDMWNSILELLHEVAVSFRNAWNDGTGEQIAANLLEIFTNIYKTIGNIAERLKAAWISNETGEKIFSAILGIISDVLSHINSMSKATSDWAKTLDFTPLLTSIKNLLESIRPLADKVGGGLEWFYKNVLLPLAKYSIEDLIPAFLDALKGAIDLLSGVIDAFKPAFDFLWNSVLKPLAEWTGGVIVDVLKGLGDVLSTIGGWLSEHAEGFSNFVIALGTFVGAIKVIGTIGTVIEVLSGIFTFLSGIGGLGGVLSAVGTAIGTIVGILGGPITIAIGLAIAAGVLLWKNWDTIKELAGKLGDWIGEKWEGIKTATSDAWDNVKNWTSEKWEDVKKTVTDKANDAWSNVKTNWGNIKTETSSAWTNVKDTSSKLWATTKDTVSTSAKNAWSNVSSKWNDIKTSTNDTWTTVSSWTSSKWKSISDSVSGAAKGAANTLSSQWDSIKTKTDSVFGTVVDWASNLGNKIGSGFSKGFEAVARGARDLASGFINAPRNALNGVLGGIRWVLNKVGASGMANSIVDFPMPSYARGTGGHPGGLALVNDGAGAWQESYMLPNGQVGVFPKVRNMVVDMPKGTQVATGKQTAQMLGVPMYANGIGSFFGKLWNGAQNAISNVWDFMTDPSSLFEKVTNSFVNLTGLIQPTLSIAQGAVGTVADGAINFFKNMFESEEVVGSSTPAGTGVERWRSTIVKALGMNGLPTNETYVSAWLRQVQSESGGNEKAVQGGYVDVNTLSGDLAKGLLQTISATFNAYKFSGHGNIFNGFDNALAAINYAKNRYGSTGMLSVIGHGHGYENGGLVTQDGLYRMGEGNKKEMVIPLEKPQRAAELIQQAIEYLGLDMFDSSISLPEMFQTPTFTPSDGTFSSNDQMNYDGGGMKDFTSAMITTIMNAISAIGATPTQASNGDIIINIGGKEFGRIAVKEINKYHKQLGYTELNV